MKHTFDTKRRALIWWALAAAFAVGLITTVVHYVNRVEYATNALNADGYQAVVVGSWTPWCYLKGTIGSRFSAVDENGKAVNGKICNGLFSLHTVDLD